jgi:hypothetical protein
LIEGIQVKNRKLAVLFVCRILKETQASRVFNLRNPWMISMLTLLREIQLIGQASNQWGNNEFNIEIEFLFKTLNIQNPNDIKPSGILESLNKPNNFVTKALKHELEHIQKKVKFILPANLMAAPPAGSSDEQPQQSSSPSQNQS